MYKIIDWFDYFFHDIGKIVEKNWNYFVDGMIAGLLLNLVTMIAFVVNIPVFTALLIGMGIFLIFKYDGRLFEVEMSDMWRNKSTFPQVLFVLLGNVGGALWIFLLLSLSNFTLVVPIVTIDIMNLLIFGVIGGLFLNFCNFVYKSNENALIEIIILIGSYVISGGLLGLNYVVFSNSMSIIATYVGSMFGSGIMVWFQRLKTPEKTVEVSFCATDCKINKDVLGEIIFKSRDNTSFTFTAENVKTDLD